MKKILVIGMADSIHLANWLQNMRSLPMDVTLVSSSPHRRIHPKIAELLKQSGKNHSTIKMPNWSKNFGFLLWIIDRFLADRLRGVLISRLIQKLRPDIIHAIEFQHAGYILLRALRKSPWEQKQKVMVSNYGSDIYWFQKYKRHRKKISTLLKLSDHYTSECKRDLVLATALGFEGNYTLIPNTGGIPGDLIKSVQLLTKPSERKVILLKGYQSKFGQALQGIYSFHRIRKSLSDFQIVSFSTNLITAFGLIILKRLSGLKITFYLKGKLSHEEVLSLMSQARVYIGLSKSDGISTSLLEAMAMGAFPIQTGTSCASEWVQEGTSGAIVSLEEKYQVDSWIKRSLTDDALVDEAREVNSQKILARYSRAVMTSRVEELYLKALKA